MIVRISAALAASLVAVGVTHAAPAGAPPRLEPTYGPPVKIAAGLHRSPAGFRPDTTFRVGSGWWGGGDAVGWGIGKGLDRVEARFAVSGIYVDRLSMSYAKAVAAFKNVDGLRAGRARLTRIGGHRATVFHPKLTGDSVVLEAALGVGADIGDIVRDVTFVDVRGKTLLVRTEIARPPVGAAEASAVVRSFRFAR